MVLRAANASGRSPLRALHLGFTRIGETGLEVLSQLQGLTALSLEGEGVSGQSLQVRAPTGCAQGARTLSMAHFRRMACCILM